MMKKILFSLFLLLSLPSYSLDLMDPFDRMMFENLVQDAVIDAQIYDHSLPDSYGYAPPLQPKNKLKFFGKDQKGIKYSIFLESIQISKSGRGISFYEGTESDFPRYEDKVTFFTTISGINIDCDSKEMRFIGRRFYDVNMMPIILNPKGKTNIEQFVKKYNFGFEKIPNNKNNFANMYMKFICR
jgi:hypothetical protein